MTAKILYLITELDIGGAEKNLYRLATSLGARGWDVEVAALSGHGEVGSWLESEGVSVHYVEMESKLRVSWFARLARTIRVAKPDVLHTFLFHANIAGRVANLFGGARVVVSSVRVAERRRRSHLYMDFLTQWLMDREICVSEGVRAFTERRAHVSASKLEVIPNPVEPLEISRPREEVRAELGARGGDRLVLSIGRLDVQKGYAYLLEAASALLEKRSDLLFVVAGDGSEREALQDAIDARCIADRFRLVGWRGDIADLYNAADVFVLPSLWEGMPNAVLEAATFALPIVATAVEGTTEVIEDGRTGVLVPAGDAGQLAVALERVVDGGEEARRMGREAHAHVLTSHSMEAFVRAHEELYRALLSP